MRRVHVLAAMVAAVSWSAATAQTEDNAQSYRPDSTQTSVVDLINQGNTFASKYFDNRAALELYNRALKIESSNANLLWHISQAYIDIGEHLPTSTDDEKQQQLAMYEKALEFADKSVTADGSNSMAYTRRAIAIARIARFRGFWETLGLLKDVRSDLDRAIVLDSANHLAFYMLGRLHMRVTERPWIFRWPFGLGWGSLSEALSCFERAIALKGDIVEYRMGYAKGLIEDGDYVKAREQLLLIPNLPTMDEDDERLRREGRELIDLIKDET